ncbi:hypothetical protein Vafri_13818 [Volvox africanus]|uniref:Diphthine--ammonia ligase n=1 Tax=Volvox africanus TaxID=51714 RepID=A0A8J4F5Z1_9CHLO|nr:hypothetical protein Vafri_13818 [Volvox africanus]
MAAVQPRGSIARKAAISFTGGKDSMTVLHLMRAPEIVMEAIDDTAWREDVRERIAKVTHCEVALLVTFVPAGRKQSFKAHPLEVVQLQAHALGLPHLVMEVESAPSFLESYKANIRRLREEYGITALATGDILDVCNSFMPRAAAGTGVDLIAPLWGIERRLLLELVWAYSMSPLITCVNVTKFTEVAEVKQAPPLPPPPPASVMPVAEVVTEAEEVAEADAGSEAEAGAGALDITAPVADIEGGTSATKEATEAKAYCDASVSVRSSETTAPQVGLALLGRQLNRQLHEDVLLPAKRMYGVDECGEWGEYHTMVTDSRLFVRPLHLSFEPQREGDFAFLALRLIELDEH